MANGRNRRQTRSALDRMARVQRFAGVGTYDYGPAAAITTDFGQIARDNLQDFRNVQETARKARERIDAAQKEASEAQDYEMTGIADVDKATMSLASDFRDHLREERNNIGKVVDGKLYTISDFVAFKNNVINNSKIWKGHPELINKTLERMREDKTLDPISVEAYAETAGLILNPGGAYSIRSSRDPKNKGNIQIFGRNPDGTKVEYDLKNYAVNGVQEVKNFDATADIKDFQTVYAGKKQTFEIDGQMYTAKEVMDNPILFTKHIKTQSDEFEEAKNTHLDNFMNDDQQVISYLRQMGKKVEYNHSDFEKLSEEEKKKFGKIYLNKKGRFVVSDTLREEAREKFKKQIDGAFGVQEEGKAQVMRNYDEMGPKGTAKPIELPTIDSLPTIVTDSENNPQKPGQSFGVTDYRDAFNRSMDPNKNEIREDIPGRETVKIDDPFINKGTFDKMTPEHKARNSDLFKGEDALMYGYGGTGRDIERQINQGNIDQVGFSMGLNLSKTQLDALNITATKPGESKSLGSKFSSINGISFTFDRRRLTEDERKKKNLQPAKNMDEVFKFDINERYPMRIKGVHLVGPIDTRVERKLEGGSATNKNVTGDYISVETKSTADKEAGNLTISDLVSESQIPQFVEMIGKENPVFKQLYRKAMTESGAYPAKALYVAVQKAQSMQNQLVIE